MVKHSSKRQKLANEQLEEVRDGNVEIFAMFMQEYSLYVPFRSLWSAIRDNKMLIRKFDELATNEWWRLKLEDDFFDFYDAVIEPGNTVKDYYLEWISSTTEIHTQLLAKPWKLMYMVCYGTMNLLSERERVTEEELISFPWFVENFQFFTAVSGSLICRPNAGIITITSWTSNERIASFRVNLEGADVDNLQCEPIRNGCFITDDINQVTAFYDIHTKKLTTDFLDETQEITGKRTCGDLIELDDGGAILNVRDNYKVIDDPYGRDFHLLNQDYYVVGMTIFQWPQKTIQIIEEQTDYELRKVFGPYNFSNDRFLILFKKQGVFGYSSGIITEGKMTMKPISIDVLTDRHKSFSYGVVFSDSYHVKNLLLANGKIVKLQSQGSSFHFVTICGPFMFVKTKSDRYKCVDLWNTLQEARKEKITFISTRHCYNCGFLASFECSTCNLPLCSENCEREIAKDKTIACGHNTPYSTK